MIRRILGLSAIALAFAAPLGAQAYFYPAFQPTRVAEREYNFVLADNGNGNGIGNVGGNIDGTGTGLIFQWREGLGNQRAQFTMDAGFADPDAVGADARLILGAGFAYQLLHERQDMPFDMVFASGIGMSFGDNVTTLKVPVGVAIGHRFPIEGKFAITPYVHPRLSIDYISIDTQFGNLSDTELNLDIDLGGSLELNEQMQIRLAALLGDADAIGISFAWMPRGLRR